MPRTCTICTPPDREARRRRRVAQQAIRKTKSAIIARDGFLCGLCRTPVDPQDLSIDHIIPITRGGTDHGESLQVAHRLCNARKGNRAGTYGA